MIAPRRIVVGLTGQRWGGVHELAQKGPINAHVVIGSLFPYEDTERSSRLLDGRIEIGATPSESDEHLSLLFVSDGAPGSVTREQVMTAVRVCAAWRGQYRGDRGKIPIEASDEIRRGEQLFDIVALRTLVHNWENSGHTMRGFPSRYSQAD